MYTIYTQGSYMTIICKVLIVTKYNKGENYTGIKLFSNPPSRA
jgi:hypothetical protein